MHEGGIATSFIAHWPKVIEADQIVDHVAHIIDLMPTFIDMAGGSYPATLKGNQLKPLEGISFLPLLRDREQKQHETLYCEHLGYNAIRHGKWKLVSSGDEWKLYDLEEDRTELNDLAGNYPDTVEKLSIMWEDWAIRANVK